MERRSKGKVEGCRRRPCTSLRLAAVCGGCCLAAAAAGWSHSASGARRRRWVPDGCPSWVQRSLQLKGRGVVYGRNRAVIKW